MGSSCAPSTGLAYSYELAAAVALLATRGACDRASSVHETAVCGCCRYRAAVCGQADEGSARIHSYC